MLKYKKILRLTYEMHHQDSDHLKKNISKYIKTFLSILITLKEVLIEQPQFSGPIENSRCPYLDY